MQYEGKRVVGPNGERGIIRNGQVVPLDEPTVAPVAPMGGIRIGNPDPRRAIDVALARENLNNIPIERETREAELRNKEAELRNKQMENRLKEREITQGPRPTPLSEEQRNELLKQRVSLGGFSKAVDRVEQLYNQDFAGDRGGILGIGGDVNAAGRLLPNWLRPANERFSAAANSLIGPIAAAQGATGGEMNSVAELQARFGPMIPQPGDSDATIQQKLEALREIEATQQAAVAAQMGQPLPPQAPAGMDRTQQIIGTPNTQVQLGVGDGATTTVEDPVLRSVAGKLGRMISQGASAAEVRSYLKDAGVNPNDTNVNAALRYRNTPEFKRWQQANPNAPYPIGPSFFTKEMPQTATRQFLSGMANSAPGAAVMSAGQAVSGNMLDDAIGYMGGNAEQARAGLDAVRTNNPGMSLLGDVGGAMAAYAGGGAALGRLGAMGAGRFVPNALQGPGARMLAGDAAYGAYSGYGNGDVTTGALGNMAGGVVGRGLARGVGRTMAGVGDPTIRRMTEQGYPLTPGQMLGQSGRLGAAVQGVENRLAGTPVVGDFVANQHRRGLEHMNRRAHGEIADIAGEPATQDIGERAAEATGQIVSRSYRRALNGVRVAQDPRYTQDIATVVARSQNIPELGPQVAHIAQNQIGALFDAQGQLTGQRVQAALQILANARAGYEDVPGVGREAANELRRVERAITGMVRRQAPQVMPALGRANAAYRRLAIVQKATGQAVADADGVFTAAQLGRSARANTQQYGGRAQSVSTRRPFFQLQEDARRVLPNRVPDSGTAGRLAQLAAGGALVGGGAAADASGLTNDSTRNMAMLAGAVSLPYTNRGQALLQAMMAQRSAGMRQAGENILTGPIPNYSGRIAAPIFPFLTSEDY